MIPEPVPCGNALPASYPSDWCLEHPVRGAATIGLHVFDILDQDFPFVYVQNLVPWYRLPEAVVLHVLIALGLLGRSAWLTGFARPDAGEIRGAIIVRVAFLFVVGAYVAVYGVSASESRFGVALLWALLPFSFLAVRGLIAPAGKRRWTKLSIVLVYTAMAVRLSVWVTALAPAIVMARQPFPVERAHSPSVDYGPLSIAPKTGTGLEQVFRVSMARTVANQPPTIIGLLVNDRIDGGNACYVLWNFVAQDALLVNDSGSGSKVLGKASSVANRQCELLREGSAPSITDSEIGARFHLRFRRNLTGPRQLYVIVEGMDRKGPGLVPTGTWTVPQK